MMYEKNISPPIVIGGIGGSGTRLIAQLLQRLGVFIGCDLNEAYDNLWFTLLFKRPEIIGCPEREFQQLLEIFYKGMLREKAFSPGEIEIIHALASRDRPQHHKEWLQQRVKSLLLRRPDHRSGQKIINRQLSWGWKEPNSHIIIDRLARFSAMKYIHVARNGLDMAHSTNKNQLKLWGEHFTGKPFVDSPAYALNYWCIMHRRITRIGAEMGDNFLFLNYDQFCLNPGRGLEQFIKFIEPPNVDNSAIPELAELITIPSSTGRFRQYGIDIFSEEDLECVRRFGFDIG